jgi:hypothetical protein
LATLAPKVFFDKNKLACIRHADLNTLGLPCGYQNITGRRLYVKHMAAFLQDTMLLKSLT